MGDLHQIASAYILSLLYCFHLLQPLFLSHTKQTFGLSKGFLFSSFLDSHLLTHQWGSGPFVQPPWQSFHLCSRWLCQLTANQAKQATRSRHTRHSVSNGCLFYYWTTLYSWKWVLIRHTVERSYQVTKSKLINLNIWLFSFVPYIPSHFWFTFLFRFTTLRYDCLILFCLWLYFLAYHHYHQQHLFVLSTSTSCYLVIALWDRRLAQTVCANVDL